MMAQPESPLIAIGLLLLVGLGLSCVAFNAMLCGKAWPWLLFVPLLLLLMLS